MQKNEKIESIKLNENFSPFIVNSRMRLIRNIKDFPFVNKMNDEEKKNFENTIIEYIMYKFPDSKVYNLKGLKDFEREFFLNKGYISRKFFNYKEGYFILIDDNISIMFNCEDHIVIRMVQNYMFTYDTYEKLEKIENVIGEKFAFASSSKYGYLTSNITNCGLGLMLSVLVHLKGLVLSHKMQEITQIYHERGYAILPWYYKTDEKETEYFKVMSKLNFGMSEKELIERFIMGIEKLIEMNVLELEKKIDLKEREDIQDEIYRSFGILQYARDIEYLEAFQHLTNLRVGLELKIDLPISSTILNNLFVDIQDGNVKKIANEINMSENRTRAIIIKEHLKERGNA